MPLLYVPSTLPEKIEVLTWGFWLMIEPTGDGEIPMEYAESCEFSLLSGDQFIADAFAFTSFFDEETDNFYSVLTLDSDRLTQ